MNRNAEKVKLNKRAKGMASFLKPLSENAEQFHMLNEAIELAHQKKSSTSIMITSATSQEGVSTTASNYALVSAQTGKKVLLIDADFRTPSLQDVFNINVRYGLSDYLNNKGSLKRTIISSGITNLDLVLTGHYHIDHPSQLLHSSMLAQFMDEVESIYDLIIVDTPPLIPYSDGQIIAQHTDGAILVVRSRMTQKEEVIKAKERLIASKARFLGVVFNNSGVRSRL